MGLRPGRVWFAIQLLVGMLMTLGPTLAADTPTGGPVSQESSVTQPSTASQSESSQEGLSGHAEAPSAPLAKSPRIALVLGNKDYAQAPLKNPLHDASDIRDALLSVGFEVIYRENADVTAMTTAVREFKERIQEGGVAMVYYSGHGAQADGIN